MVLPQRRGWDAFFTIIIAAGFLAAICSVSLAGVRKQTSEMISEKQSASTSIPPAKLKSIMKAFRSSIQSQLEKMENKMETVISNRKAEKGDTSAKNSHSSKLSRKMLKQQNDELFAWNAALQHQILLSCVSATVSKESVSSTQSVHEIKEGCLKRVMGNVEHAIKEPTTKRRA
jgi:hypothetical protein